MNAAGTMQLTLVTGGAAPQLSGNERFALLKALLEKGYSVSCVGHAPEAAGAAPDALVFGQFEESHPAAEGNQSSMFRPLRLASADPAAALAAVDAARTEAELPAPGTWKPWFPVIDYKRCTNCMQCLSFCLFDVYGVSGDGQIQVQNNDNCKTDCPACSRVCPEVAILFPKYRHGPINGDEVNSDDLRREAMKVDISALLGGDIYAALRDRSAKAKSRFSKERDEDRALQERQNCLIKLTKEMDIPSEVMAALPSLNEIRAKAEAAQARAQAALQAQKESEAN